jgi:molybdopterin-guanine dinucleotide biosynthesis protein A
VAHREVAGVLLLGGASRRFGSPKALARFGGETLAERAWRVLGDTFVERIAVGKSGELDLPFRVLDDGSDVRAPLAGVVAGLRAVEAPIAVFLPVDVPLVDAPTLHALACACRDAAVTQTGPLPAAFERSALSELEARLGRGDLRLGDALSALDTAVVDVDPRLLANVNEPADLVRLLGTRFRTKP